MHPTTSGSEAAVILGLVGLEEASIIAKPIQIGWLYLNSSIVFNGDRIAFTILIERDSSLDNKIE